MEIPPFFFSGIYPRIAPDEKSTWVPLDFFRDDLVENRLFFMKCAIRIRSLYYIKVFVEELESQEKFHGESLENHLIKSMRYSWEIY